jgi:hypothetical protein
MNKFYLCGRQLGTMYLILSCIDLDILTTDKAIE